MTATKGQKSCARLILTISKDLCQVVLNRTIKKGQMGYIL